ncbi:MAG TPA: sensor histidine kinase KdpD [Acetobacteraceae bacterium]|nr:sensor histidine kinase KdpD [Acetobacteraceae bacterium]
MATLDSTRPTPEQFLQLIRRQERGRLKVYLGSNAGVGKTYAMLREGHRLRKQGVDVAIGLIETHGRAETAEQIGDLEVIPPRRIEYRGMTLREMDLDAVLARRPTVCLVDELAHTNVPGSRHHKRWEDVAELLEAGIHVWSTLNVQHLESLNDAVAQITGVRVSETLPDRVLEMADEIELVDLSPGDLRERLREGRIYQPDVARRALEGFFREGNLAALRELALRRAAQHVDQNVRDYMRQKAIPGPWPAGDRVLALIGADDRAEAVVRQAKRLADALHAPWIALHFERPDALAEPRPALDIAAQLGAEVESRAGSGDLVRTIVELARSRNVTHIVAGRGHPPFWRRMIGRTLIGSLVREGGAFTVHVVANPGGAARPPVRTPRSPATKLPWLIATLCAGVVVAAGELMHPWLHAEALGMMFIAGVVAVATMYGLAVALYSAALGFLCWNILFIPPVYRFTIYDSRDIVALLVFVGVAGATGLLASRVRAEARAAQSRIEGLRRIAGFTRSLGVPTTETDLCDEIARQAASIAERSMVLIGTGGDVELRSTVPPADMLDEASWAAARWAYAYGEPAGRGTATLPSCEWRFLPLRTVRGVLGALGMHSQQGLNEPQVQALSTLADQGAAALERIRFAAEAAHADAQAETQKLRTALLNSLSHDLRTPLTSIRGSAGLLRASWDSLAPAARADLLSSIEHDTVLMTGFLANIMEMTRLESGEIAPQFEKLVARDVVDAALARMEGGNLLLVNLPEDLPAMRADPQLLETVLVNALENAAKYSPAGSVLRVTGERQGNRVCIAIADEGMGIPADDLPHIFDSFYRVKREDRTRPGTGLGLAIARGLVEAMEGTITVQSPRPDAPKDGAPGTVVTVCLPVAP